ncbi:MAG: hypothetical protein ACFNLR_07520 [Prevotella denticola]
MHFYPTPLKEDNKLQENRLTSFVNRIALYPTAPEYCPEREEAGNTQLPGKIKKNFMAKEITMKIARPCPLQILIGKNDKIEKNTSNSTPAGSHFSLLIT